MFQPLKMQGEARNCKNGHFCALRARLCALRASDRDAGLTVPANLPDGPSVRILSLYDNSFNHLSGAPFPNGGDPPVLFPLRTRLKKGTSSLRSEVKKPKLKYKTKGFGNSGKKYCRKQKNKFKNYHPID